VIISVRAHLTAPQSSELKYHELFYIQRRSMGKWKFLPPGVKSLVENFKNDFHSARPKGSRSLREAEANFGALNHNQRNSQITAAQSTAVVVHLPPNVDSSSPPATNTSNPVASADSPQPIIVHAQLENLNPASSTSASSSPPGVSHLISSGDAVDSYPEVNDSDAAGGATLPVSAATATTEQSSS